MHLLACLTAYLVLVILRLYTGTTLQVVGSTETSPAGNPSNCRTQGDCENVESRTDESLELLEKALQTKYGSCFTIDFPHQRPRRDASQRLRRDSSQQAGFARPKPLSMLMNFGLDGVSQWSSAADEYQDDCPQGSIYDPYSFKCRQAVCVPVAENDEVDASCITNKVKRTIYIPANATSAKIFVTLGLHHETDRDTLLRRSLEYSIERVIEQQMQLEIVRYLSVSPHQVVNVTVPNFSFYIQEEKNEQNRGNLPLDGEPVENLQGQVEASFVLRRGVEYRKLSPSIVEMYDQLADAVVGNDSFVFYADNIGIEVFAIWEDYGGARNSSQIDSAETQKWCKQGAVEVYCNNDFDVYLNGTKTTLRVHPRNKTYVCGEFKLQIILKVFTDQLTPYLTQVAMVCEMPETCPSDGALFFADEAKLLSNMSLEYLGKLYDISEYKQHRDTGKFMLCGVKRKTRAPSNSVMGFNMREDLSWLSSSLSIISVIALSVTVVLYGIFRDLRTLPGWNLINVMLALIVAQVALLLNSVYSDGCFCEIIGIITHFTYLLGFFFANVIAFDIYRTFGSSGRSGTFRVPNGGRRSVRISLLKNMVYCYVSAGVIVGSAVILDQQNIENWEVQYATICWIAGERASLLFFATPIIVINVANVGLVGVTYYRLRIHKKTMQGLLVNAKATDGSKREALSYVRIGSVFGFTWIFGIISGIVRDSVTDNDDGSGLIVFYEILIYIFILTQSCQGIMIFLAFGINAKMREKIAHCCKRIGNSGGCRKCEAKVCRCLSASTISKSGSNS